MPWLEWLDRNSDASKAGQAKYRLLETVARLDHGESGSPNMLIQGDIGLVKFNADDPENPDFQVMMRAAKHEPDYFYANDVMSNFKQEFGQ